MPNEESAGFVVVTGGPGAGKTTLIEALGATGHATMQEAGRAVIRSELAADGTGLPWQDRESFAALMLAADLASYEAARTKPGLVFFDRGLPDIVGYLQLCGLAIPAALEEAAQRLRYRETVFIAPPWPEIYAQDAERKQDLAEAERTFAAMRTVYPRYGYRLVELPRASVAERTAFVEGWLGRDHGR